jgi:chitodextrinase
LIFRDSLPIAITTGTSYTDDSVSNNTTYEYRIEARDAVNNRSDLSLPLRVSRTTP